MEENKEIKKVEKIEEVKEFALVQVPTGQELAFQTPEGEIIRTEELLVIIANNLEEVRKTIWWLV